MHQSGKKSQVDIRMTESQSNLEVAVKNGSNHNVHLFPIADKKQRV